MNSNKVSFNPLRTFALPPSPKHVNEWTKWLTVWGLTTPTSFSAAVIEIAGVLGLEEGVALVMASWGVWSGQGGAAPFGGPMSTFTPRAASCVKRIKYEGSLKCNVFKNNRWKLFKESIYTVTQLEVRQISQLWARRRERIRQKWKRRMI